MFYAAHHTHDVRFVNDVDTIYRFPTRRERDEFVNDEPFTGSYHLEAVTRRQARRFQPIAFDEFVYEGTEYEVPNWWTKDPNGNEFWNVWEHTQV